MNNVVGCARVVWKLMEYRQKNGQCLPSLHKPFFTRASRPDQTYRIKQACIDILWVCTPNLIHAGEVSTPAHISGCLLVSLVHRANRIQIHLLTLCSWLPQKPGLELIPAGCKNLMRSACPGAFCFSERDAPRSDTARRIQTSEGVPLLHQSEIARLACKRSGSVLVPISPSEETQTPGQKIRERCMHKTWRFHFSAWPLCYSLKLRSCPLRGRQSDQRTLHGY